MINEHLLQFYRILLLGCDIKFCLICTQHLAYVVLHNELLYIKVEILLKLSNKVTRNCVCIGICLMTPNNESFDGFNRIISIMHIHGFSTTHYTMWRMQCVIYMSNKSEYLKNKERYGKTIDGEFLSRVLSNFMYTLIF